MISIKPVTIWADSSLTSKRHIAKGPWDPFLNDLLSTAANRVSTDDEFYFNFLGINNEIEGITFLNFFLERDKPSHRSSLFLLKGKVGIGKSSFLKWFSGHYDRYNYFTIIDINHDSPVISNTRWNKIIDYFAFEMANELLRKLINDDNFQLVLTEKISLIQNMARAKEFDSFEMHFISQNNDFLNKFPSLGPISLLSCIVSTVTDICDRPIWLVIDNVDLEIPSQQSEIIRSAHSIYNKVTKFCDSFSWKSLCHLVITVRPETCKSWTFFDNVDQDIEYPVPDVLGIANRRLFKGIDYAVSKINTYCPVKIGDSIYLNSKEMFAEHVKNSIKYCTSYSSWPFGKNPKEWHICLVNRNVRRFIKAYVHFVISGNFQEIWCFSGPEKDQPWHPSPYLYIRMIIRGQFQEFAGNHRIDGSGENADSPLFFNVFGFECERAMPMAYYYKHYFIYIRILQYLTRTDEDVVFEDMAQDLTFFFEKNEIIKALKILLWSRLIEETNIGARNIGGYASWNDIPVNENTKFRHSKTTCFYVNDILSVYEYISSMAMVSCQMLNSENSDKSKRYGNRKILVAQSTLAFLTSYKDILYMNLSDYSTRGVIDKFPKIFVSHKHIARPFNFILNGCISSLRELSKNEEDLVPILNKIIKLKDSSEKELSKKIPYVYSI